MSNSIIIAGKYRLLKKIGAGSFGKIFSATDNTDTASTDTASTTPNNTKKAYAVKVMALSQRPIMENEVAIYEKIREIKNIPSLYESGNEGKINYIVMDLLGQSLEEFRTNYGETINRNIVLHLGMQMLMIIEQVHAYGIIHRDLKPSNFLLKTNAVGISELYLIDFGLAKCFLDEKSRHYTIKTNETMVGTLRYMSVNSHHGLTASRRDDLESLGYIMMFLYHGTLPWQNQKSVADVISIKQKLVDWTINTVGEFVLFILYCRNLGFADKPNYTYLQNIFLNLSKMF